jgi:hypothetical protein
MNLTTIETRVFTARYRNRDSGKEVISCLPSPAG